MAIIKLKWHNYVKNIFSKYCDDMKSANKIKYATKCISLLVSSRKYQFLDKIIIRPTVKQNKRYPKPENGENCLAKLI